GRRFGVPAGPVLEALRRLAEAGTVVEGQFRPGTSGTDWCDTGVLRTLRGRSLARLRREVEPVEQDALGRFAVAWHGIDTPQRGQPALLDAIAQLEGAFAPASDLEPRRAVAWRPSSATPSGSSCGRGRSRTTRSTRCARSSRRSGARVASRPVEASATTSPDAGR